MYMYFRTFELLAWRKIVRFTMKVACISPWFCTYTEYEVEGNTFKGPHIYDGNTYA